jgi:uroporphyrinogen decarboxylase
LDWTTDIGEARQRVGHRAALQGNLDPMTLYAPVEVIRSEVRRVLDSFGTGTGHVFNLGHGILPDVDPDRAAAMIEAVHDLSPAFHSRDGC